MSPLSRAARPAALKSRPNKLLVILVEFVKVPGFVVEGFVEVVVLAVVVVVVVGLGIDNELLFLWCLRLMNV